MIDFIINVLWFLILFNLAIAILWGLFAAIAWFFDKPDSL